MNKPNNTVNAVFAHGPTKKPNNSLISILELSIWNKLVSSEATSELTKLERFNAWEREIALHYKSRDTMLDMFNYAFKGTRNWTYLYKPHNRQ